MLLPLEGRLTYMVELPFNILIGFEDVRFKSRRAGDSVDGGVGSCVTIKIVVIPVHRKPVMVIRGLIP